MLNALFDSIRNFQSTSTKLYKAIEEHYRYEGSYVTHHPMNIVAGTCGSSSKPQHTESFKLGSLAYKLISFEPNSSWDDESLDETFEKLAKEHQVPEQFKPLHKKLLTKIEEFKLQLNNFNIDPNRFTSEESVSKLLDDFARKLVDPACMGCTPEIFASAVSSISPRAKQKTYDRRTINFWISLKNTFDEAIIPRQFSLRIINDDLKFVPSESEGDKINKLAKLLPMLTSTEISILEKKVKAKIKEEEKSKDEDTPHKTLVFTKTNSEPLKKTATSSYPYNKGNLGSYADEDGKRRSRRLHKA